MCVGVHKVKCLFQFHSSKIVVSLCVRTLLPIKNINLHRSAPFQELADDKA